MDDIEGILACHRHPVPFLFGGASGCGCCIGVTSAEADANAVACGCERSQDDQSHRDHASAALTKLVDAIDRGDSSPVEKLLAVEKVQHLIDIAFPSTKRARIRFEIREVAEDFNFPDKTARRIELRLARSNFIL